VRNSTTIPDKRIGTRSKFSPLPTFNVDNQVIFSNIDWGGRGIHDTAQVSQLLLAGIVAAERMNGTNKNKNKY